VSTSQYRLRSIIELTSVVVVQVPWIVLEGLEPMDHHGVLLGRIVLGFGELSSFCFLSSFADWSGLMVGTTAQEWCV